MKSSVVTIMHRVIDTSGDGSKKRCFLEGSRRNLRSLVEKESLQQALKLTR